MLLSHERIIGQVYDPFRHDDGIGEACIKHGNAVLWSSVDFLSYDQGLINVVSEPRPDLGEAYARQALSLVTAKVVLLLPVQWMTGANIKKMIEETPLCRVYILTRKMRYRPRPMAWYVFEKGNFEPPVIRWL